VPGKHRRDACLLPKRRSTLSHPPGSIALDRAQRTGKEIGQVVIAHLVEIAIAKAIAPRLIGISGQTTSSVFSRKTVR
jgi:hypothetical protein